MTWMDKEATGMPSAPPPKANTNTNTNTNTLNRYFLLFLAGLQNVLGSALLLGWAGIAGTILIAPTEEGGAGLTLYDTSHIFSLASCVMYVGVLFTGVILDRFGPRGSSAFSLGAVSLGCGVVSLSRSYVMYALGFAMMAFGGNGTQASTVHLGNLFPRNKNMVITCLTSTLTLSLAVFPFFSFIWETFNISISFIFGIYAVIMFAMVILSILVWPDAPFPMKQSILDSHDAFTLEGDIEQKNLKKEANKDIKNSPFVAQLCSGIYMRTFLLFFVSNFWANFYLGTLTLELFDEKDFSLEIQQELEAAFTYIVSIGIIFAPAIGFSLDKFGFPFTAAVTVLSGILQIVFVLTVEETKHGMVWSFWMYSFFRKIYFSYLFSCLSSQLGFLHYGKLLGITFAFSGLSQLLISPFSDWARAHCNVDDICDEGKWRQTHVINLVCYFILLLIPCMDSYENHKNEIVQNHSNLPMEEAQPLLSKKNPVG